MKAEKKLTIMELGNLGLTGKPQKVSKPNGSVKVSIEVFSKKHELRLEMSEKTAGTVTKRFEGIHYQASRVGRNILAFQPTAEAHDTVLTVKPTAWEKGMLCSILFFYGMDGMEDFEILSANTSFLRLPGNWEAH